MFCVNWKDVVHTRVVMTPVMYTDDKGQKHVINAQIDETHDWWYIRLFKSEYSSYLVYDISSGELSLLKINISPMEAGIYIKTPNSLFGNDFAFYPTVYLIFNPMFTADFNIGLGASGKLALFSYEIGFDIGEYVYIGVEFYLGYGFARDITGGQLRYGDGFYEMKIDINISKIFRDIINSIFD